MARYTGPVCRLCRREGMKLFLKGARCYTKKCAFERRPTPPGQHGVRRRKMSEFGVQLREKQKVRRIYSVLERQFRSYFDDGRARPGVTGENLLAPARDAPRQRRLPDGLRVQPRPGPPARQPRPLHGQRPQGRRAVATDSARATASRFARGAASTAYFKTASETLRTAQRPDWLSVDADKLAGNVTALPRRDQMPARAQRAARGRVLLEVVADDDRTGEPADRAGRGADALYGKYEASPLPAGYGVTIGNALRRVLLSSLEGAAVTSIQVRDVYHEFSSHPGRQGRRHPDRPQRQEAAPQELRAPPGPAQAGQVGRRRRHRGRHHRERGRRDRQSRAAPA